MITFSEIHVSNKEYQSRTPYLVSIVETEEGVRLPGILKVTNAKKKINVGDSVRIDFDLDDELGKKRQHPNYYFVL